MKIKSFYPLIFTTDAKTTMKNLETFGFTPAHNREGSTDVGYALHVLKDNAEHRVDVLESTVIPRNFVGVRVNVDDYDEAVSELKAQGYTPVRTDGIVGPASHTVMLRSPQNILYMIMEHTTRKEN